MVYKKVSLIVKQKKKKKRHRVSIFLSSVFCTDDRCRKRKRMEGMKERRAGYTLPETKGDKGDGMGIDISTWTRAKNF